jgi:hypothetical protein
VRKNKDATPESVGKIMFLHVKEAKYLRDYVIWIKFNDSIEGEVDLEKELTGEIFGPLKKIFSGTLRLTLS